MNMQNQTIYNTISLNTWRLICSPQEVQPREDLELPENRKPDSLLPPGQPHL